MFGLTSLGVFHTAISLIGVAAGFVALARQGKIDGRTSIGRLYVGATVITCLTGFGIFQHGGFGKAHVLGAITLITLAVAALAGMTSVFGRLSRYVETIGYSATLLFNMIPAVNETATRLPPDAPLAANDQAPVIQGTIGLLFVSFIVAAVLQARSIRAARR